MIKDMVEQESAQQHLSQFWTLAFIKVVKTAFINALPKNVTMVDPPMKRFGACFSSKNIRSTNVGPVIDFVFHKKRAFWRIYGANSVVQVRKDVMCLAFVGVDQTWKPSNCYRRISIGREPIGI